jgi:hypothetical protein
LALEHSFQPRHLLVPVLLTFALLYSSAESKRTSNGQCSLESCRSFHELLNHRDKDILDSLSDDAAFVCFIPKEDKFLVAHFSKPTTGDWQQREHPPGEGKAGALTAGGSASITTYRNGEFEDLQNVEFGQNWRASGATDAHGLTFDVSPVFAGQSQDKKAKIRIDDAEFDSSDEFDNEVNSITSHRIAIRFSTARFTVDYRWDEHGVEKTQNKSGHCEIYSQGKRVR